MNKKILLQIALLTGLASVSTSVFAIPVIVMAVVGAFVGAAAVVTGVVAVSLVTAVVVGAVVGAATGYALSGTNAYSVPDSIPSAQAAASYASGLTVTQQGSDNFVPVIYGRRRVGGSLIYLGSRGDSNKYLYQVIILAEGRCAGPERIYLDDELVWTGTQPTHGEVFSANTGVTTKKSYTTFQYFEGNDWQTTSSIMANECGWNSTDQLSGLAYIVIKTQYPKITTDAERDANPWGGVPVFNTIMRGQYVFDGWDSMNVNSPQAYSNTSGWVVSYNPVSCLADYIRNPRFGKGLKDNEIDWTSWKDAGVRWNRDNNGNVIDESRRHKCNAAVFTDRTVFDNVTNFLYNMRAAMPFQQGLYKLRVEDNGGANGIWDVASGLDYTFDVENILGDVVIESDSAARRFNKVVISYPGGLEGPDQEYDMIDLAYPFKGSALETTTLAEDNNRVSEVKMSFEHITDSTTASYMAQLIFNLNRYKGKTLALKTDSSGHNVEVMDIVNVVYPGLGINGKFRVRQITVNSDYTFGFVLSEHVDQTYAIPVRRYNLTRPPEVGYVGATAPPAISWVEDIVIVNGVEVPKQVEVANGQSVDVYWPSDPTIGPPNPAVNEQYLPAFGSIDAVMYAPFGNLQGVSVRNWVPSTHADFPLTILMWRLPDDDFWSTTILSDSSSNTGQNIIISGIEPGRLISFKVGYMSVQGVYARLDYFEMMTPGNDGRSNGSIYSFNGF